VEGHCDNGNQFSGLMKGMEFLDLQKFGQVLNASVL
jgi:hypothetical protein